MVATKGTGFQEALRLFGEAGEKAAGAIAGTEELEREVKDFARDLVLAMIKAVTPALKLVDHSITTHKYENPKSDDPTTLHLRGVSLRGFPWNDERMILCRDGHLYRMVTYNSQERGIEEWTVEKFAVFLSPERALELCDQMAVIFSEAMVANERRHESLVELRDKLAVATTSLKKPA